MLVSESQLRLDLVWLDEESWRRFGLNPTIATVRLILTVDSGEFSAEFESGLKDFLWILMNTEERGETDIHVGTGGAWIVAKPRETKDQYDLWIRVLRPVRSRTDSPGTIDKEVRAVIQRDGIIRAVEGLIQALPPDLAAQLRAFGRNIKWRAGMPEEAIERLRGSHVAIKDGRVVDRDQDRDMLMLRVRKRSDVDYLLIDHVESDQKATGESFAR